MVITDSLVYLSVPILESLVFFFVGNRTENDDYEPRKLFDGGTPMLTHVRIGGIPPTACLLPLSSVTSLHLEEATYPMSEVDFLAMLRLSPTLVSLHLGG